MIYLMSKKEFEQTMDAWKSTHWLGSDMRVMLNKLRPVNKLKNVDFANTDQDFKRACEKVGLQRIERQASKFRNKRGLAYSNGRG